MHSMWSGSISFGLINIPVKLYSGSEDHELKFTMLHKTDNSPIRYARICRADGKEIPYADIVKGYEYQKGDYIVLSPKDFEKVNVHATHSIDIIEFTDEKEMDIRYFEKPYYLEPESGAEKAYTLLYEALQQSKKVAVANIVLYNREHIAAIKPIDSVLVLDMMRFKSEIRKPKDLKFSPATVSKQEITMALTLISQLTRHFKPEEFHDTYTEELEKIIQSKAKGHKIVAKGKAPKATQVKDLLTALKKSLASTKSKKAALGKGKRKPKAPAYRKSA